MDPNNTNVLGMQQCHLKQKIVWDFKGELFYKTKAGYKPGYIIHGFRFFSSCMLLQMIHISLILVNRASYQYKWFMVLIITMQLMHSKQKPTCHTKLGRNPKWGS
jgi:hypothetical protein